MYLDFVDKMLALWRWKAMSAVLFHPSLNWLTNLSNVALPHLQEISIQLETTHDRIIHQNKIPHDKSVIVD